MKRTLSSAKGKQSKRRKKPPVRSKVATPAREQKKLEPTTGLQVSSETVAIPQASIPQEISITNAAAAKEAEGRGSSNEALENDDVDAPESPDRMRTIQRFQKLKMAAEKRWESLRNSKEWVWETYKLKFQLEPFVRNNRDQLEKFFGPTFFVTAQNYQTVKKRIDAVDDAELKALLHRYARYARRYGTVFTLQQSEPSFRTQSIGYGLNTFNIAIRNGKIEPIGGVPPWEEAPLLPRSIPSDDFDIAVQTAVSDDFESDQLGVPSGLQSLVTDGKGKYVLIKDEDNSSPLRQIADLAYSPDQVTVIDYEFGDSDDLQSRRFLLVGENVPLNDVWPKLRALVASYQRRYAGGDQRGRATDVRQLTSYLDELVRGGDSLQDMAAKFVKDKMSPGYPNRLASMMSRLSQLKKKLQE